MAYTKATNMNIVQNVDNNRCNESANVELEINTPDCNNLCTTNKSYTEKASIVQD